MSSVFHDLRFGWRVLRRQPLLTTAAMLSIAFGVGANTAVVSVLETVLLNPLGLRHADRVMAVRVRLDKLQMRDAETSAVEYREVRAMTDTFSAVSATEDRAWTEVSGGQATRLTGRAVTPDFFRVFAEEPAMGRFFAPEDRQSIVLSHALWQSQFGGDTSVLGRTVMLDGTPFHVIGVASPSFRFPVKAQAWVPLVFDAKRLQERGMNMNLALFARLRTGVTPAQASDRVNRYIAALETSAGEGMDLKKLGYAVDLSSFGTFIAGDLRKPLWLVWAAALVLLLTACANVAGLLLSRTAGRRREIAIRLSVGASRWQVLRQLLIESALLGGAGGVAGLVFATAAVSMVTRFVLADMPALSLVTLDWKLLLYGITVALLCGLICGLAPALQTLRESQTTDLTRSRRRWFQDIFITAEVGGALLLVIASVLLLRSLWAIQQVRPGFDPHNVTTAYLIKPAHDPGFLDRLRSALRSSPGVESAALANPVPFSGGGFTSMFGIKGRHQNPGEPEWHGEAYQVSPEFFQTLRIPLLRGRNLSDADTATSKTVCVIDTHMAERFFPNQDAIGQEIAMYSGWARIVGVVAAIRGTTLEEAARPVVYYSFAQVPYFPMAGVLVRSSINASSTIRAAVRQANLNAPVYDVQTMDERIGESLGIRRLTLLLLGIFGAASLLLAAIGIYGVIAQVVGEQTREIGIRMALGARPAQILSRFMTQGLRSGFAGIALGLIAAVYAQSVLASMLYQVHTYDLLTFASAIAGIAMVVALAIWSPARRASRIDPQEALRHE